MEYIQYEIKAIEWDEKKKAFKDTKTNEYYTQEDIDGIIANFSGLSFPEIKNISNISKQKKFKLDQDLILEQKRQLILKNGIEIIRNWRLLRHLTFILRHTSTIVFLMD